MRNADRQRSRDQHSARVLRSQRIARSVLRASSEAEHRSNLERMKQVLEQIERPKSQQELAEAERIVTTPTRPRQGELL